MFNRLGKKIRKTLTLTLTPPLPPCTSDPRVKCYETWNFTMKLVRPWTPETFLESQCCKEKATLPAETTFLPYELACEKKRASWYSENVASAHRAGESQLCERKLNRKQQRQLPRCRSHWKPITKKRMSSYSQGFDSILFCCPKILGYKTHPENTTDLELSTRLSLEKCCAL